VFEGGRFDTGYASKIFTFTQMPQLPEWVDVGGFAIDRKKTLPEEIEHMCPDYDLYGLNHSLGFLTRGCPNHCPDCGVPEKEGNIRPAADIEEFARHRDVVLMDNNVLACDPGCGRSKRSLSWGCAWTSTRDWTPGSLTTPPRACWQW